MMEKSKIQRRFTLTIPRSIRKAANLKEGDVVYWSFVNGKIILTKPSFKVFRSRFKVSFKPLSDAEKEVLDKVFLEEASQK